MYPFTVFFTTDMHLEWGDFIGGLTNSDNRNTLKNVNFITYFSHTT